MRASVVSSAHPSLRSRPARSASSTSRTWGQAGRWYARGEDPGGEDFRRARDEAHRLRTAARQALYRVKLLTDDEGVVRAAERAYRCTWDVSNAQDQPDHDVRDTAARQAIESFVSRASPVVR